MNEKYEKNHSHESRERGTGPKDSISTNQVEIIVCFSLRCRGWSFFAAAAVSLCAIISEW
jgi:hypothetical protein